MFDFATNNLMNMETQELMLKKSESMRTGGTSNSKDISQDFANVKQQESPYPKKTQMKDTISPKKQSSTQKDSRKKKRRKINKAKMKRKGKVKKKK